MITEKKILKKIRDGGGSGYSFYRRGYRLKTNAEGGVYSFQHPEGNSESSCCKMYFKKKQTAY
jgi:hypothetical protein